MLKPLGPRLVPLPKPLRLPRRRPCPCTHPWLCQQMEASAAAACSCAACRHDYEKKLLRRLPPPHRKSSLGPALAALGRLSGPCNTCRRLPLAASPARPGQLVARTSGRFADEGREPVQTHVSECQLTALPGSRPSPPAEAAGRRPPASGRPAPRPLPGRAAFAGSGTASDSRRSVAQRRPRAGGGGRRALGIARWG